MNKAHQTKSEILKALGHPVRYCIVEGLADGEHNVADMVECVGVAQPTVSQHLNILKAAGIIRCERDGTRMMYRLCSPEARRVVSALA
jgi:ArsR family transcriptional regulator